MLHLITLHSRFWKPRLNPEVVALWIQPFWAVGLNSILKDLIERWERFQSRVLSLVMSYSCSSTVVALLRWLTHTACVFEKADCAVVCKTGNVSWYDPRGASPGQTLLTLWKTHPPQTHTEMETYKLTTGVKKYPHLYCVALTWKVSTWAAEQWVTQPASWCHCETLFMLFFFFLEAIL